MSERYPSLKKHLGEIAETQFVPESPQDNEKDHISGIFQEVELRSSTFIEAAL